MGKTLSGGKRMTLKSAMDYLFLARFSLDAANVPCYESDDDYDITRGMMRASMR